MSENFYREHFERSVKESCNFVLNRAAGNYTKSYETWKRINNVVRCFGAELKKINEGKIKVLDVGCGDGYHIFLLNSLYNKKNLYFTGIDISYRLSLIHI